MKEISDALNVYLFALDEAQIIICTDDSDVYELIKLTNSFKIKYMKSNLSDNYRLPSQYEPSKVIISLSENNFWNRIPESGGVYFIQSYNDKLPNKLYRFLGQDEEGVLYIGKSENIREKLRMLWRVLNPKLKATAHTFGTKYNENKKLSEAFPLKSLYVSYRITTEPKKLESELLNKYFLK